MDDAVVIKDELADRDELTDPALTGMPVDGRLIRFKNTPRNLERVMKAYERDLKRRYPTAGERLAYALKEAAMNFVMHGYPNTEIAVHDLQRGGAAHGWVAGQGPGFDPRKTWERKQCWCDSPGYIQELGETRHGLGMFLIANQVERFIYENQGNLAYVAVLLSDE